jgi:hypothetical protein
LSKGGIWLIELQQKENDMREKKRAKNLKKNLKKKNGRKGSIPGMDELNVSLPVEPVSNILEELERLEINYVD